MAKYSGSITLISGIKQANNGTFPLVDASAVQVDDTGKRLNEKLSELSSDIITTIQPTIEAIQKDIGDTKTELQGEISTAKTTLEGTISNTKTTLEGKISTAETTLEDKISSAKTELEGSIGDTADTIRGEISTTKTNLEGQIDTAKTDMAQEIKDSAKKIACPYDEATDITQIAWKEGPNSYVLPTVSEMNTAIGNATANLLSSIDSADVISPEFNAQNEVAVLKSKVATLEETVARLVAEVNALKN